MQRVVDGSANRPFANDLRGSVTVEYTVLLVLVALGAGAAVVALGPPLARMFLAQQTWLSLGVP